MGSAGAFRLARTKQGRKVHLLDKDATQMSYAECGVATYWDWIATCDPSEICSGCRPSLERATPTPTGEEADDE